ncbi:MAG: ubiquinone biosynthesis regulatory protein kinase UbiB [Arsenophonus sp.]|nr:MAG: ubiquinone biosynthesis regulatory protein kinase UbiB [Arsenophonus sp.]
MQPKKLKRFYYIMRIFLNYGLDEIIPKIKFTLPLKLLFYCLFWLSNKHKDKSFAERLRLALQDLGPIWIKFGQMLSTRRDLFSENISDQLALLQNNVISFDGRLARQQIEKSLGGSIENWFEDFNEIPLASASISQVHTAKLKNNKKKIVIKVIRPDILLSIKADINLMYKLSSWISLIPNNKNLRIKDVVKEYEKTLINELNLLRESFNAIQLKRNFKNSSMLYVPKVYLNFCSKNIMVMERIYGIPISNIHALKKHGINMKILAERGVNIFFTQVFRDSFFHADMHPGNIFISKKKPENPKYIGIDYGIVGSLNQEDKFYLAENLIAFFNRDYKKITQLHITSGWMPHNTNIHDFEFAIREVCEPIFKKPLAEISFGHILFHLFNTARNFNMKVQPQLLLFQKTLLYIEGLGKQLYPSLDLWETANPFLKKWIQKEIGLIGVINSFKQKTPGFYKNRIPEIPQLLYTVLYQHTSLKDNIEKYYVQFKKQNNKKIEKYYLLGMGATSLLCGTILAIFSFTISSIIFIFFSILLWSIGWLKIIKKDFF